jgi:hypothetical protein
MSQEHKILTKTAKITMIIINIKESVNNIILIHWRDWHWYWNNDTCLKSMTLNIYDMIFLIWLYDMKKYNDIIAIQI